MNVATGVNRTLTYMDPSNCGAWITDSGLWLLAGGRYRRTPRYIQGHTPPVADPLEYGTWTRYNEAEVFLDTDGNHRLRLLPTNRPAGSTGVLTGVLCWTNLWDGQFGELTRSTAAAQWFPPSPVPADKDLWPGELPFTAFGQFGPDALDLRVFDQDVYWVDRNGAPYCLCDMGEEYLFNVLLMLESRSEEFHHATIARQAAQTIGDAFYGRVSGESLATALTTGSVRDSTPHTWLYSTPLYRKILNLLTADVHR